MFARLDILWCVKCKAASFRHGTTSFCSFVPALLHCLFSPYREREHDICLLCHDKTHLQVHQPNHPYKVSKVKFTVATKQACWKGQAHFCHNPLHVEHKWSPARMVFHPRLLFCALVSCACACFNVHGF